ncbi:MAG: hypothetical protein JXM73_17150 [Anaerolineae bacterium]|nr:hypothetical protein [Anaerolineae bacterium]
MDWGPFPELAAELAITAPVGTRGHLGWLWGLKEAEDPWRAFVQTLPWPSWLGGAAGTLAPSALSPGGDLTSTLPLDLPRLPLLLIRCRAWLSIQVIEYLGRLFAPLWEDIPAEFTAVSIKAVAWTLYAYTLDTCGPHAVVSRPLLPTRTGQVALPAAPLSLAPYILDRDFLLGDALCLHLHVERLAMTLRERLPRRAIPCPTERKPGGLRTASFLETYAAAVSPDAPRVAADWRRAMEPLIDNSPITLTAYLDLLGPRLQAPALEGLIHFSSSSGTRETRQWPRDLWYSHLARSLHAAIISEPPVLEKLLRAEDQLERLKARPSWWSRWWCWLSRGRWGRGASWRVKRAEQRCQKLRKDRVREYRARLVGVASLFASQGTEPTGMLYVHVRLLDLLVRHVAACSMPVMLQEWRAMSRTALPFARIELFREDGACFDAFQHTLIGEKLSRAVKNLGNQSKEEIRTALVNLLELPEDLEPKALARGAGVPEGSARALVTRFVEQPIALPLRYPNHQGPSPRELLAESWLASLLSPLMGETVSRVN